MIGSGTKPIGQLGVVTQETVPLSGAKPVACSRITVLGNLAMPDERRSERPCRVLDVNHATMRRTGGRTRSVEQERAKGENCTLAGKTHRFSTSRAELIDHLGCQPPEAMRSIEDPHRSVVDAAGIKMQPNRQHARGYRPGAARAERRPFPSMDHSRSTRCVSAQRQ